MGNTYFLECTYIYLFLASYAVSNSFAQAAAIWCYLIVSLGGLLSQFREIRFWWKICLTGKNTVSHCLLNLVGSAYNWKIFSIAKEMCGIYQRHCKMYKHIYHYQLHRRECAGGKQFSHLILLSFSKCHLTYK